MVARAETAAPTAAVSARAPSDYWTANDPTMPSAACGRPPFEASANSETTRYVPGSRWIGTQAVSPGERRQDVNLLARWLLVVGERLKRLLRSHSWVEEHKVHLVGLGPCVGDVQYGITRQDCRHLEGEVDLPDVHVGRGRSGRCRVTVDPKGTDEPRVGEVWRAVGPLPGVEQHVLPTSQIDRHVPGRTRRHAVHAPVERDGPFQGSHIPGSQHRFEALKRHTFSQTHQVQRVLAGVPVGHRHVGELGVEA